MTGNRRTVIVAAASVAAVVTLVGATQEVIQDNSVSGAAAAATTPPESTSMVMRPLNNNCSAGYVTFTFDDGPRENTEKVLDALDGLGIDAVFFWNGQRVRGREHTVARAIAEGHIIGNHSWDHPDLRTGELPDGSKETWTADWVRSELELTNEVLVAAGAPRPTLYRPPYGAINQQVDAIAQELGMRLVMPWGFTEQDNIVDTLDNEGADTQEIVDIAVRGMRDQSIITMHDGQGQVTLNAIDALQGIVDAMNEKGLCATTKVRGDATGNVLAAPG